MNDINQVILIGNLVRDSEIKYTQGGMAISSFSIAVNRSRKQGDQYVDEVSFFDINVFGKSAENLNKYLLKGTKIAVVGYLKQERWTDRNGNNASKVVVNAEQRELIGGNKPQNNQNQPMNRQPQNQPEMYSTPEGIPF